MKVKEAYSDDALNALKNLADDARSKRAAATVAAETAFKDATFPGVGAEMWRALGSEEYREVLCGKITHDERGGSTVINAGISETSDPKKLPQRFPSSKFIF
ncbi:MULTISPECIES: hypothetical protein [Rhizobium]|jgi:hypothetical protein|uniref:Uncharacterized protein n=1 Tax=Rhizobium miluonense TaxID=411945 RepID=A0ABU1SLJ2_9HYPH|nr:MULTISPECIES: hypothetical protein [Rhizobium]MBB3427863.1 hypothetical protein [Rhizobium sp. BK312]MDR6899839.1 hypothetical protein [Rhizobium miluonense]